MSGLLYERVKASDMLESIMDSCVILEEQYNLMGRFYGDIYAELNNRTSMYSYFGSYRNQEWQVRNYIHELRQKGL